MKAEFVNTFLEPAMNVWQKELGIDLTFREAESVNGTFTTEDLTAVIGVTGKLKGNVFYELSRGTAQTVASAMCGQEFEEMDELPLSAIGELANMITGNATTALSTANYICDISPPVLLPRDASVTVSNPQIRAHFDSSLGSMSIRIGLTEVAY
jgi:chemotaxis protein CheX